MQGVNGKKNQNKYDLCLVVFGILLHKKKGPKPPEISDREPDCCLVALKVIIRFPSFYVVSEVVPKSFNCALALCIKRDRKGPQSPDCYFAINPGQLGQYGFQICFVHFVPLILIIQVYILTLGYARGKSTIFKYFYIFFSSYLTDFKYRSACLRNTPAM